MTVGAHTAFHHAGKSHSEDTKEKIRNKALARNQKKQGEQNHVA